MNTLTNVSGAVTCGTAAACVNYADFALALAKAFLILAFLVALLETGLALWGKLEAARKGPEVARNGIAAPDVDPVKFLEALKALLEILKGLPAWIALFLAGIALLWFAGGNANTRAAGAPSNTQRTSNTQAPSNTQASSNTQAPSNTH